MFKGFHGEGELTNKTFPELDDHLLGHVDAAFRMPSEDSPDHHEHLYFFLVLYIDFHLHIHAVFKKKYVLVPVVYRG